MKSIIALFCSALLSFSVFAGAGNSTERGPWVDCKGSGHSDYTPSEVCKSEGGMIK